MIYDPKQVTRCRLNECCSSHTTSDDRESDNTRVGPKVSGLTYKSRAKWEMLRGIYSAFYGEVNVSVCIEIRGDYIKK
jgi:hypothetical protein